MLSNILVMPALPPQGPCQEELCMAVCFESQNDDTRRDIRHHLIQPFQISEQQRKIAFLGLSNKLIAYFRQELKSLASQVRAPCCVSPPHHPPTQWNGQPNLTDQTVFTPEF